MHMIDFLTLLLVNMVAGFVLLAAYLVKGLDEDARDWAPGFAITGLVALLFGGYITLTWPLPGPYNVAYGEMSVFFGMIFLGASWAMAKGRSLKTVALYAFFAGLAAVVIGARFIDLKLSAQPLVTGFGFILSGLAGVFSAPVLTWMHAVKPARYFAALLLLLAALIWAVTGYASYWLHLALFK